MIETTVQPNLWLRYDDDGVNFGIRLTDEGRKAFGALSHDEGESVDVYDVLGNKWAIRRAVCGAGCHCAAAGVVIEGA